MNRTRAIDHFHHQPAIDVLIIGAGINGIGTFRDLALQGISSLIIDRADFCSGASMASSHMLHGGIRYLENGEFRLVREALHERNNLLRSAPHLAHPLPTTIPLFRWFSGIFNAPLKFLGLLDRPAERGAVVIKLGLMMYDAYVRGDSPMPAHRFHSRAESLKKWPSLNNDIIATATYYDGAMPSPERLALEVLLDGKAEGDHAHALNYVSAVNADGEVIILRDELSGDEFSVRPRIVVNAAGPWIDFVNNRIDGDTSFIGGTKGSHIVVDHPELRAAIGDHEFFFEHFDGRIVLLYPYLDRILLGTTDIRIDDPDDARCTAEEIDYILNMVPHVFPGLNVEREHIVFKFSGVRPLPPAQGATGQISRDHSVKVVVEGVPWPILSLVGGKWTTFRAFAAAVTDTVLERLGLSRRASTEHLPIGGGRAYPDDPAAWIVQTGEEHGVPEDRMKVLFERYGTRASDVAAFIAQGEDSALLHHPDYSRREIIFLVQREMVTRLDDIVLRRSLLAWLGHLTRPLLDELAAVTGEVLGWSAAQQQEEVNRALAILADHHGVTLPD